MGHAPLYKAELNPVRVCPEARPSCSATFLRCRFISLRGATKGLHYRASGHKPVNLPATHVVIGRPDLGLLVSNAIPKITHETR